jgi:hypothetical protein
MGRKGVYMPTENNQNEEVDALCKECGHAFKAFVDRILPNDDGPGDTQKAECPVCGCGDCKIGH